MDLQEEYFRRKKVPAHLIKYVDHASLILRAKEGSKQDCAWLHVTIDVRTEPNHPSYYQLAISANPVIYASSDFSHFSYHNTKLIQEQRLEWEQYEGFLLGWASEQAKHYSAIPSSEAIFVTWEMFFANYDSWVANFMPYRVIGWLADSLKPGDVSWRMQNIRDVEDWIKERYERVFACWKSIRQGVDQKNYADWLAQVVNSHA